MVGGLKRKVARWRRSGVVKRVGDSCCTVGHSRGAETSNRNGDSCSVIYYFLQKDCNYFYFPIKQHQQAFKTVSAQAWKNVILKTRT